jgi:hypothetical protein
MADVRNPFDLLDADENADPEQLAKKAPAAVKPAPAAAATKVEAKPGEGRWWGRVGGSLGHRYRGQGPQLSAAFMGGAVGAITGAWVASSSPQPACTRSRPAWLTAARPHAPFSPPRSAQGGITR